MEVEEDLNTTGGVGVGSGFIRRRGEPPSRRWGSSCAKGRSQCSTFMWMRLWSITGSRSDLDCWVAGLGLLSDCRVAPAAAMADGNAWDEDDIRGSALGSSFSWYGSRRFLLRKKIRNSSPINMIPARLPVIPPAMAADSCELPGWLTS